MEVLSEIDLLYFHRIYDPDFYTLLEAQFCLKLICFIITASVTKFLYFA